MQIRVSLLLGCRGIDHGRAPVHSHHVNTSREWTQPEGLMVALEDDGQQCERLPLLARLNVELSRLTRYSGTNGAMCSVQSIFIYFTLNVLQLGECLLCAFILKNVGYCTITALLQNCSLIIDRD